MQIMLDTECWTVLDETPLMQILAEISDRAQAKQTIVTSLKIGGRPVTDRDLVPDLLARSGKDVGPVEASSRSTTDILGEARDTIRQFGECLEREALTIVEGLRRGTLGLSVLDGWLGRLADYVEVTETARAQQVAGFSGESLVHWTREMMAARTVPDTIRLADLLEYEVIPRLGS